jgi:hypothetical protein
MRAIPTIALVAGLAACASDAPPRQVASMPPSVSYQVTGSDVGEASERAAAYCGQFNAVATMQNLQPNGGQSVVTYSCVAANNAAPYPGPVAGAAPYPYADGGVAGGTVPVVRCADPFHQNLPGGSDYHGPTVPGCPPTY